MGRLYPTLRDSGKTTTTSFDVRGTRDIFKLPAGQVGLAVGAEVRHEKYSSIPDPITASGVLSVLGASSSEGSRTIQAGYAELSIPVFKGFEASLAGRYDHYSDFGSTTNPKVGLQVEDPAAAGGARHLRDGLPRSGADRNDAEPVPVLHHRS